ncbi:ATPase, histidine kinase-, DNA gyrase B-, and HSP90-like domain protein [Verrucomicrobiia bacterium DG1235]|nr:ATPase, histidine kinase-, DNA gyrase B-, and HSP90-like domain protein [Verrucomicrobiae bacterium DG1235]
MSSVSQKNTPKMVKSYHKLSLRRKLIVLISLVAGFVTFISMLASFLVELSSFKSRLLAEHQTSARMIASTIDAAIIFDDPKDGSEILSALSQQKSVVSAGVYLPDGRLFTSYRKTGEDTRIAPPDLKTETGFNGQHLIVKAPIALNGPYYAHIVLKANIEEITSFIYGRLIMFVVLVLASILTAIVLASRLSERILRPITELAKTTRRITEDHDVSTRQKRISDDETGQLVDAFNEMMAEIEKREDALVLAKETAEASSRAKDDFLSVISHELRTPLNPIIGYVEILLRKTAEAEDRKQLGLVKQYATHLQDLIDHVIDYSRFERGIVNLTLEPVDYQRLCQNVINLLERQAKSKGVTMTCQHQFGNDAFKEKNTLSADRVKLQQVVLNLVANAVKFTESGSIKILTFIDKTADHDALLRIEVQDTGIGISEEDREKVFKPFSQIDVSLTRQYSGLGLGLAITKKIVEAMNGQIGFNSDKGVGSVFWIEVPVNFSNEIDPDPSIAPALHITKSGKKGKVLLVDDQLVNLELGESMLTSCGHEVVCARSGMDAIELAKKENFNLIILDIKMPNMNGYDTAKELRKLENGGYRTPIIAMTAHVTTRGSQQCLEAGMDDFLPKPFNTERLNLIIHKWLDR